MVLSWARIGSFRAKNSNFGPMRPKIFAQKFIYSKLVIWYHDAILWGFEAKIAIGVLLCSSVHKNVSSYFALPKYLPFMCRNRAKTLNFALSIQTRPLNKAVFSLGGLGF